YPSSNFFIVNQIWEEDSECIELLDEEQIHFGLRITSGYENGADLVEVYFNFDDHIYKTSYKRVQGVYQ
ncbi:MAG: hypothetical protein J6Y93_04020, partial [Treponema sp.]|nr:hypothetical protein [Treponema sp.]